MCLRIVILTMVSVTARSLEGGNTYDDFRDKYLTQPSFDASFRSEGGRSFSGTNDFNRPFAPELDHKIPEFGTEFGRADFDQRQDFSRQGHSREFSFNSNPFHGNKPEFETRGSEARNPDGDHRESKTQFNHKQFYERSDAPGHHEFGHTRRRGYEHRSTDEYHSNSPVTGRTEDKYHRQRSGQGISSKIHDIAEEDFDSHFKRDSHEVHDHVHDTFDQGHEDSQNNRRTSETGRERETKKEEENKKDQVEIISPNTDERLKHLKVDDSRPEPKLYTNADSDKVHVSQIDIKNPNDHKVITTEDINHRNTKHKETVHNTRSIENSNYNTNLDTESKNVENPQRHKTNANDNDNTQHVNANKKHTATKTTTKRPSREDVHHKKEIENSIQNDTRANGPAGDRWIWENGEIETSTPDLANRNVFNGDGCPDGQKKVNRTCVDVD